MDGGLFNLCPHFGHPLSTSLEGPTAKPTTHFTHIPSFLGKVWLTYDQAFCKHAATTRLTDWSLMNINCLTFMQWVHQSTSQRWFNPVSRLSRQDLFLLLCAYHGTRGNTDPLSLRAAMPITAMYAQVSIWGSLLQSFQQGQP